VPSAATWLLAAAAVAVPFGSTVEVHVGQNQEGLHAGSVVGDFLVVTAPHPASGGTLALTLRPLAIGTLHVPLSGDPVPPSVEVGAALPPASAPAPLRLPAPPPLPWWPAAGITALSILALWAWRRRRSSRGRSPLVELRRALAPLADSAAWGSPQAPDVLALQCRRFLSSALRLPCIAMTTREVGRLLARGAESSAGRPFTAALALADELRFAGSVADAAAATTTVQEVLVAAESLAEGGRVAHE
jgi:hypothetical protein